MWVVVYFCRYVKFTLAVQLDAQVEIDPNSAIYKAEKVDVKTGEEDEETIFTLEKAKLFEYQKSEGDSAVSYPPALPWLPSLCPRFHLALITYFSSISLHPATRLRLVSCLCMPPPACLALLPSELW